MIEESERKIELGLYDSVGRRREKGYGEVEQQAWRNEQEVDGNRKVSRRKND